MIRPESSSSAAGAAIGGSGWWIEVGSGWPRTLGFPFPVGCLVELELGLGRSWAVEEAGVGPAQGGVSGGGAEAMQREGGPGTALADRHGVDEVTTVTVTHDLDARRRSCELLADVMELAG